MRVASSPTAAPEQQYSYGVARKVLARSRRGRVRRSELAIRLRGEFVEVAPAPQPLDEELGSALSRLGEKDRELLLLIAWEGFGVAEAGAMLGFPPAAARKRYSRVRERLRAELGG